MTCALHPGQIRSLVCRTLRDLGAKIVTEFHIEETLLVREGRCLARSYRTDEFFAMWLVELGLLQFYNAEGDMLLVLNLLEEAAGRRMAA